METTTRRFLATSSLAKKKPTTRQKRPPQRGLGVEKLERLFLQEHRRMMTDNKNSLFFSSEWSSKPSP